MKEMVSVALPVYNGAQYLSAQLDSILCQLEEQDELVIAYQASEDRSLDILTDSKTAIHELKYVLTRTAELPPISIWPFPGVVEITFSSPIRTTCGWIKSAVNVFPRFRPRAATWSSTMQSIPMPH